MKAVDLILIAKVGINLSQVPIHFGTNGRTGCTEEVDHGDFSFKHLL
jgi:hypothetical protein